MALKIHGTDNIQAGTVQTQVLASGVGGGPKITSVVVTDSSYTNLDDTAVGLSGGYIKITGTGFVNGCQVVVGATVATSITFVSSTEVRAQIPAQSAGSYTLYLTNSDGGVAIRVNAVNYSSTPSWTTTSPLSNQIKNTAINIQLTAISNSAVTYALQAGSSLPSGLSLSSNGMLSGTAPDVANETTYNFTVIATDTENQDTPQAFQITINVGDLYYYLTTLQLTNNIVANAFTLDNSNNNLKATIVGNNLTSTRAQLPPLNDLTTNSGTPYFDGATILRYKLAEGTPSISNTNTDVTIESWVRVDPSRAGDNTYNNFWELGDAASGGIALGWWRSFHAEGRKIYVQGPNSLYIVSTFAASTEVWYHVAVVRSNGVFRLYIDGTSQGTFNYTPGSTPDPTWQIGNTGGAGHKGWMYGFRVVVGTAVYTSNFTRPSTSPTAIANTQLLALLYNKPVNNNLFEDTSSNSFQITRNGNPTQGTFSPYSANSWSVYFDGTGDYLSIADNNAFAFGSGDWTVECWVFISSISTQGFIAQVASNGADASVGFVLGINASGYPYIASYINGAYAAATASTAIVTNQWNHIAGSRAGGTLGIFLNGSRLASTAVSGSAVDSTAVVTIGASNSGTSALTTGYISNVRIVKGTAIYSGATYTVPTGALGAVAGTSLLACQSNRFVDNSTNNFAITTNGDSKVRVFGPFKPTAVWSAATYGNSAYFDGSGDYLATPTSTSFTFGSTGDFTVELWAYLDGSQGTWAGLVNNMAGYSAGADYNSRWGLNVTGTTLRWDDAAGGVGCSATLPTNAWVHIAVARSGSTITLYTDGISRSTQSTSQAYTTNYLVNVGYLPGQAYFKGYISNLRIVKGTAVYTANFTPPTQPFTAIANTSLLLNFNSSAIFDSSGRNHIETIGSAHANNSVSDPFNSTAAMVKFDGTNSSDYLQIPDTDILEFNNGDFTVETWVRFDSLPATTTSYALISKWDNSAQKSYYFYLYNNAGTYQLYFTYTTNGSSNINPVATVTPVINTWYHYAVSRSGTNLRLFVNGNQVGSTYNIGTDTIFGGTYPIQIGASATANVLVGALYDLRVTKYARYTANFTPPTEQNIRQ
jgi:hypothetical protein